MFRSRRFRQRQRQGEPPPQDAPRVARSSLLLLGLLLGLAGGLVYAWLINPIVYVDARPARMSARYQDEYIFLVSQSYAYSGAWEIAQRRLAALDEPSLPQRVAALFERYLREGAPAGAVRNLATLTRKLGGDNPALALFNPTPQPPAVTATATMAVSTPTATLLPTPSPTPIPTNTSRPSPTPSRTPLPTATPRPAFRLLSQERLCSADAPVLLIAVEVVDALLDPLPGVEVIVTWEGGSDRFFTGFRPDQSAGYADFAMLPGISYTVRLAGGSPEISGLRIEACPEGPDGGWQLTFQNLRLDPPTATPTP
ncbi:MAG: hypothetical protein RRC07_08860 [Anaerolineae bacterium]|nr:hypothetical protein [Anaerolineae bacterium]